jgi:hypothetical protein
LIPEPGCGEEDWRKSIADYLWDPSQKVDKGIRRIAFKFTLINGELYHRTAKDLLLKCLDHDQAKIAMGEVYEGICGTHQSAPKMKWLLRRAGFYWPTMITDCFWYYKGCEDCQKFGNIQMVPAATIHPIIKSWPFRGWAWILSGRFILRLQRVIALCWWLRIISQSGPKLFL